MITKAKPNFIMDSSNPQTIEINSEALNAGMSSTPDWPETNSKWLIIIAILSCWTIALLMSVPCLYYAIKERDMTLIHPGPSGTQLAQKAVVTCRVIVGLQVVLMLFLISGTGNMILAMFG